MDRVIENYPITFNEAALSDIQILCFYAYSDLYATSPANHDEAITERTNILGPDHCVGVQMNALFPSQISTSANLNVTVEKPTGNGQFGPAENMLVDFTPTCATVNPPSGRTDPSGVISTTVTPNRVVRASRSMWLPARMSTPRRWPNRQ
ncbi:MAG: Ig-like domain-containing protein [Nitrospirae bacterium]|nr:Ig-like domain-containing protein [Nitrospirota bacterium]